MFAMSGTLADLPAGTVAAARKVVPEKVPLRPHETLKSLPEVLLRRARPHTMYFPAVMFVRLVDPNHASLGPRSPVAPAVPAGPAGPPGPAGPVAPAGPAGPVAPVAPVAPFFPA